MRSVSAHIRLVATLVVALALTAQRSSLPSAVDAGAPWVDVDDGQGTTPLLLPDAPLPSRFFSPAPAALALPPSLHLGPTAARLVELPLLAPAPRRILLGLRGPRAPPLA